MIQIFKTKIQWEQVVLEESLAKVQSNGVKIRKDEGVYGNSKKKLKGE